MSQIFISYSRQELNFADSLDQELRRVGYDTWLDINKLQPGKPWQEQIDAAIQTAETVLLVVSAASLSSKNVKHEWQSALQHGKRLILLIFETAPLTGDLAPLAQCEWVDFRGSFRWAMGSLQRHLKTPTSVKLPPPQKGFRMPPTPRLFLALSYAAMLPAFMACVGTLFALVTRLKTFPSEEHVTAFMISSLLYPLTVLSFWFTFRLPTAIKKRRYHFRRVLLALVWSTLIGTLAFVLFALTHEMVFRNIFIVWLAAGFLGLPISALVFALWGSPGMYRWANPEGTPMLGASLLPSRTFKHLGRGIVAVYSLVGLAITLLAAIEIGNFVSTLIIATICFAPLVTVLGYWYSRRTLRQYRQVNLPDFKPKRERVFLDFAPQDEDIAHSIGQHLGQFHDATPAEAAETVLTLISRFKTTPGVDCTHKTLIPVAIEHLPPETAIDAALSREQWVDFRFGLTSDKLDHLARLLHEPALLASALGNFPQRLARILPPGVTFVIIALWSVAQLLIFPTLLWWAAYLLNTQAPPPTLQTLLQTEVVDDYTMVYPAQVHSSTSDNDFFYLSFQPHRLANFTGQQLARWGKAEVTDDFVFPISAPSQIAGSITYSNQATVYCLALTETADPLPAYRLGIEGYTHLLLFQAAPTHPWQLIQLENKQLASLLRTGILKCKLTPIPEKNRYLVFAINLLGMSLVLGGTYLSTRRLQNRQRKVGTLVLALLGVGIIGIVSSHNPLFWVYSLCMVGIAVFLKWSKDIKAWIPDV